MKTQIFITVAALLLQACASSPTSTPEQRPLQDPPIVVIPAEPTAYEKRQSALALDYERQGRLADAALVWEVLMTIRPRELEYRERWIETRRLAGLAAAEHVQRGEQAAARSQFDTATTQYLSALALQPDNAKAEDALRKLDRERNRRDHLGKLSRHTLTRKAMADAEMSPRLAVRATAQISAVATTSKATARAATRTEDRTTADVSSPSTAPMERIDVEHASLLASFGAYDDAATMLEPWLNKHRNDVAARLLMAEILFHQAESAAEDNPDRAVALLERSLQFDRKQPQATERLKQLKSGKGRKGR